MEQHCDLFRLRGESCLQFRTYQSKSYISNLILFPDFCSTERKAWNAGERIPYYYFGGYSG